MFLVFRGLTDSWRKKCFLCPFCSNYFDMTWALYSELYKNLDKTFLSRYPYLVSVVLKWVDLRSYERLERFIFFYQYGKRRKYANCFKILLVLYLFRSYFCYFLIQKKLHQNTDFFSFSWNYLCFSTDIMLWTVWLLRTVYFFLR